MSDAPCWAPECPATALGGRHKHRAIQIDGLGIPCPCGAVDWWLHYGADTPATLNCGQCAAGFNLEQLLRTAPGTPGRAVTA